MSDEYSHQLLRATVAQICQFLGWQSMHSSACDVMADIMKNYILTLAKTTAAYGSHANRTEPNLLDLSCALDDLGIDLRDLSEYCLQVDSAPFPHRVPKFPLKKPSSHVHNTSQTASTTKRPSPVGRSTSVSSTEEEEEGGEGHIPGYLPPLPSQKDEEKPDDDNESGIHETGDKDEVMDTEESTRPPVDPSRGLPQLVRTMRFSSDMSEEGDGGSRRGSFSEGVPIRTPSEGAPTRTLSEGAPIRTLSEGAPIRTLSEGAPIRTVSEGPPIRSSFEGRTFDGAPFKAAAEGVQTAVTKGVPVETTSSEGVLVGTTTAAVPAKTSTTEGALIGTAASSQVASETATVASLKSNNVFEAEFRKSLAEATPHQAPEQPRPQPQTPSSKQPELPPKPQATANHPLTADARKPQLPPLRLMSPSSDSVSMFPAQQPPLSPLLRSPGAMRPIRQGLPVLSPLGMQWKSAIAPIRQVRPVVVQSLMTSPPTTSPTADESSQKPERMILPMETAPVSPVIAHPSAAVVSPIGAQSLFAFPHVAQQQQPCAVSGPAHFPTPTLPTQVAQLGMSPQAPPQAPPTQAAALEYLVDVQKVKKDPKACLYSPPGSPQKIALKPLHISVEKFPVKSPPKMKSPPLKTEIEVEEHSSVHVESPPLKLSGSAKSPEKATREIIREHEPKLSPPARTDKLESRETTDLPPMREASVEQSPVTSDSPLTTESPLLQSPSQQARQRPRGISGKTITEFEEASPRETSSLEESEPEKRSSEEEEEEDDELELSESSDDSEEEMVLKMEDEVEEERPLPEREVVRDNEEGQEYRLPAKSEQQLFVNHGETVSVVTLLPRVPLVKQESKESEESETPPPPLVLRIQRRLLPSLRAKREPAKAAPTGAKLEVKSEPSGGLPAPSLIVSSGPTVKTQYIIRGESPPISSPEPEVPPSLIVSVSRRLLRPSRTLLPGDSERPTKLFPSSGAERVNYKLRLASFGQQRVKLTTPTLEKASPPVVSPPPPRKRELDLSEVGLLGSHPKKARMELAYAHPQPISSSSSSSSSDDDSETPSHTPSPSSSPSPPPIPPPATSWPVWRQPIRSEDEDSTPSGSSGSTAPLKLKLKISKALLQSSSGSSRDKPERKQLRSKKPPKPPPPVPTVMVQTSRQTQGNVFAAPPPPPSRAKAEVTQRSGGLIIKSSKPTAVPSITPKPGRPRSTKAGSLSISTSAPMPVAAPQPVVYICPQCNKPDDGTPMIACDSCEVWLHWYCVGIHQAPPENKQWFCPSCTRRGRRKGKKRKQF